MPEKLSHHVSKERTGHRFPIILLLIALLLNSEAAYGFARSALGPPVQAGQGPLDVTGISISTDLTPPPPPDEDEVARVSKELYCPLCTGVRVDNCDLPLCD